MHNKRPVWILQERGRGGAGVTARSRSHTGPFVHLDGGENRRLNKIRKRVVDLVHGSF